MSDQNTKNDAPHWGWAKAFRRKFGTSRPVYDARGRLVDWDPPTGWDWVDAHDAAAQR